MVKFEKVLMVKKIYIVVNFEKVVVVVVGLIQCIWSKIGWGQSGCEQIRDLLDASSKETTKTRR